jgi:hypothetical protein
MQFQKGQSGNPFGRPLGARNKATVIAETMLQGEAEELTRIVLERAKGGDMAAMRMCFDRLVPVPKHRTVQLDLPALGTAADAADAWVQITAKIAAGEIAPAEAAGMFQAVDGFVQMLQATVFEERVARLERAAGITPPPNRLEDHGGAQDVA